MPSIADAAVGLTTQLVWVKADLPVRELRFAAPRRWRFDLAWPDRMLAVEVEGGLWIQGRHSRGKGIENDMDKYNEATLMGWRVLRVSPEMVDDGRALILVLRMLERKEAA
jgi:very-short-patch-repair endonuclease